MIILPAIDLMGGQVVRLRQGLAAERTVYSGSPTAVARRWALAGGDWLHLVDLDAAFGRGPANFAAVAEIAAAVAIPCQLGGGLRDLPAIDRALAAGIARVVIGTRAVEAPDFLAAAVARFGGERIVAGIDAKDGQVAVRGWTATAGISAIELAGRVAAAGVHTIVYTDIATDGMLTGPNLAGLRALAAAFAGDLIASGGVGTLDHVRELAASGCAAGTIIGKALYEGAVDLAAAVRCAREAAARPSRPPAAAGAAR